MAFWQRKKSKVTVFYWDSREGKQKALPRSVTLHLDACSDREVDAWVGEWESLHRLQKERPELLSGRDPLLPSVQRFLTYTGSQLGRHPRTVAFHRKNLIGYALPYFSNVVEARSFEAVAEHSPGLAEWLKVERHVAPRQLRAINLSMGLYWKWLKEEGLTSKNLILRKLPVPTRQTTLKFILKPQDLLDWKPARRDMYLLGLLGFFFSLRPQETLALRPCDFVAGGEASPLEACRIMHNSGLFDRLAVNIHRQKSRLGVEFSSPKSFSQGVVACFAQQAAESIVAMLNDFNVDEPLFPYHVDSYHHLWKRHGFPGITLKDLRRASLYWLGHYTPLDLVALKNHARHRNVETTALYTRRPGGEFTPSRGKLSLD